MCTIFKRKDNVPNNRLDMYCNECTVYFRTNLTIYDFTESPNMAKSEIFIMRLPYMTCLYSSLVTEIKIIIVIAITTIPSWRMG